MFLCWCVDFCEVILFLFLRLGFVKARVEICCQFDKQGELETFCIHCISPHFQAKTGHIYFQLTALLVRVVNIWKRVDVCYLRGVLRGERWN